MEYQYSFEKLDVWQESRKLVKTTYSVISNFPKEEKYSLTNQIQRSCVSVSSNIAEGTSRSSYKEKIRFIEIAYGSLMELYCQFIIASDLNYINDKTLSDLKLIIYKISNQLSRLKKAYRGGC